MFPSAPWMGLSMMSVCESEFFDGAPDAVAGGLMQRRVAHDAALADLALAHFKLRLDQYNHLPLRLEQGNDGRQDQRDRDEADIADDQVDALADRVVRQLARVDALVQDDARIGAERPRHLARPDIHRMDPRRAGLQKRVGEPSGRGADVETDLAGDVDRKCCESAGQFHSAAAHVRRPREHFDRAILRHGVARLARLLPVDEDLAGHDQRLRLLARFGEPALDQKTVQAHLHGGGWRSWRCRTRRRS